MGMVSKVVADELVDSVGLAYAKKMSKAARLRHEPLRSVSAELHCPTTQSCVERKRPWPR